MRCFRKRRVASGEWPVGSEPGAPATGCRSHPIPDTRHLTPVFRALALAALTVPCYLSPIPSLAQTPSYRNIGRSPTQEEVRAWDIAIGPDGKELPAGSGTAKEGAEIWAKKCEQCHGATGAENKGFLKVVGGQGTLTSPDPVRTVGSFWAFATTIWDYINRAMPLKQEGSLTPNEVYALTAVILYRSGIIQQNDVLDAKTLPKVQMPNRNGFVPAWPQWTPPSRNSGRSTSR